MARYLIAAALLLMGCAAASPYDEPAPDTASRVRDPYQLTISNEATVAARVFERPGSGRAAHAYAGFVASLPLDVMQSERVLIVEVGSYRFVTLRFWPNATAPCWRLIVKQPPRLPDGPWPIDCEGS